MPIPPKAKSPQFPALPIDSLLPKISQSLDASASLVLQCSPGTGKTTRVPSHLLNSSWRKPHQEILVLEPRRLAAKFACHRVAEEMGADVGNLVGYHFRFEKKTGPNTRLCFLTEGMLLRRFLRDPQLSNVACVVLDEFHERHLHTDLAISYLKGLQSTSRPDLKLVVMSATLDTHAVSQYLGQAPILEMEAKLHPIDCRYLPADKRELSSSVVSAVREALNAQSVGDILVFLPGMREIRQCEADLAALARQHQLLVLGLHGDLSREEQDRAIQKQTRRKIVLSTNIAESALTIEGLSCVIDSGLHRQASYSWWSGVPLLSTKAISKASSQQRMGRAGRLGPGLCLRLYSKHDLDTRAPFETPEILRADLSQSVLELKSLGIETLSKFPWYAAPPENSITAAENLLIQLGALEMQSPHRITDIGREMTEVSLHPRLSRFLIECKHNGVLDLGTSAASLISEGALNSLDLAQQLERPLEPYLAKVKNNLMDRFRENVSGERKAKVDPSQWNKLCRSLLSAYPDRIALKKKAKADLNRLKSNDVELQLSSGGSVVLQGNDASNHLIQENEFFIALEIQELKNIKGYAQLYARCLCGIKEDWLFELNPSPLVDTQALEWNKERQEIKCASQLKIGKIILDETERAPSFSPELYRIWLREVFRADSNAVATYSLHDWARSLGTVFGLEEVSVALGRLALYLKQGSRKTQASELGTTEVSLALSQYLEGKRRKGELNWEEFYSLLCELTLGAESHALNKELPAQVPLPGGRRVNVNYSLEKQPWIESRLQDFFGMKEGPKLLNGSLPLTLHLLAPNYKAVQVTNDLSGFWSRTYPEVRKELSRRYPRHSWPENPLTAKPPEPRKK